MEGTVSYHGVQIENRFLYPIIFKYLYTVGLLKPHTRANPLMFILPEM